MTRTLKDLVRRFDRYTLEAFTPPHARPYTRSQDRSARPLAGRR